jgi:hypothetical protein
MRTLVGELGAMSVGLNRIELGTLTTGSEFGPTICSPTARHFVVDGQEIASSLRPFGSTPFPLQTPFAQVKG